jgi:hypothetical protein
MSLDPERLALWWGPGILVLIVFGYGMLRLAHYWIEKSAEFKRQQMDSIFGMARQYIEQFLRTQGSQADALSRLATTVEQRESVESFEHQEMLIAIKALHREVESLARKLAEPAGECQKPALLQAAAAGMREGRNGNPA